MGPILRHLQEPASAVALVAARVAFGPWGRGALSTLVRF